MNQFRDEDSAARIAARGREALLEKLRPAFEEAAAAHSDVLDLSSEQLEEMVQRAADRADGLQWRRALAAVATEELSISLGEALSHPAVVQAQAIVGAPSYEESAAAFRGESAAAETEHEAEADQFVAREPIEEAGAVEEARAVEEAEPIAGAVPEAWREIEAWPAAEGEESKRGRRGRRRLLGRRRKESDETNEAALESDDDQATGSEGAQDAEAAIPDGPARLNLIAVHLGGIAELSPAEGNIELRFSEDGLDIVRGSGSVLGRLKWEEIRELDVPVRRGLRRRPPDSSHLVIRTEQGEATFKIHDVTPEELTAQLAPVRGAVPLQD